MSLPSLTVALLLTLTAVSKADFLISNSTVCQGLPRGCPNGAQVITSVLPADYTCSNLVAAEDSTYLRNGTAGPMGSRHLYSDNVCGHRRLRFSKKVDGSDGYDVLDEEGKGQGECSVAEDELVTICDLWVTNIMFRTVYKCSSAVCN